MSIDDKVKVNMFEIVCFECEEVYGHKAYQGHVPFYRDGKKEKPGIKYDNFSTTHGLCKTCKPIVYKRNGLEYKKGD